MIWLANGVATSLTPTPSPDSVVTVTPADPWSIGFWTCFWIYTAVVVIAVVFYQIGYHRWNPLRPKKEPPVMFSHLTRDDLPDEWPSGAAR